MRFATSVRTGTASASLLLKRLGAYPRQNGALALREIGRIERTLFILDWLELPGLRRQATAELNKGEARNALARVICFHRLGRLRDRTAEAQQYRASGLALVTAAIALWNTVHLGRAVDDLRRGGEIIASYDSNKPSPGPRCLTVFLISSCLPCYPARFMASPDVACQSHLGLRPCLRKLPSAPRGQLMLAEHRDSPEIAPYPGCAGIPDRTPRTTFEIDEKFGAGTKPTPSKRHTGRSSLLSGTKFTSEP